MIFFMVLILIFYFIGIQNLLLVTISLQVDYESVIGFGPKSIHYGQPDLLQKSLARVSQLYNKSNQAQAKGNHHILSAPVSDRRPPDTNAAITRASKLLLEQTSTLPEPGNKSLAIKQQPKKSTTQLEIDEEISKLIKSSAKEENIMKLPEFYQSYPHKANSCYITGPLEALYTSYLSHQVFWTEKIGTQLNNSGLKQIFDSFKIRFEASGKPSQISGSLIKVNFKKKFIIKLIYLFIILIYILSRHVSLSDKKLSLEVLERTRNLVLLTVG